MSGSEQQSWAEYSEAGVERALALGNRGPMRFDANGCLEQSILDAYHRTGFHVFTGVLSAEEVADLRTEFEQVLDNAPLEADGTVDRHGRPVRFPGYYTLAGEDAGEPPAHVGMVSHPLMMMDSALCVYAHPQILKMVASINGADFVPFHEAVFHKAAVSGPPTPWHQDGRTHWTAEGVPLQQPDGSGKTHGFNISVSWSHCTPENCLWVVPGSHRRWRLIDGEFPPAGTRLEDAVPMLLEPGDCGVVNRSSLHGSFPNLSAEPRVTMVLGYHNRVSAIGAETTNVHAFKCPSVDRSKPVRYTEDYVLRRTRMIPLAIDARRQKYPQETPFEYAGSFIGDADWNEGTRAEITREGHEYWQQDITL